MIPDEAIPDFFFPDGEGRGRDVDNNCGPFMRQDFYRIRGIDFLWPELGIIPGVFADRDAEPFAFEVKGFDLRGGIEVSCLVEDVVSWQEGFVLNKKNFPVLDQDSRVVEAVSDILACGLNRSAQEGCLGKFPGDLEERA